MLVPRRDGECDVAETVARARILFMEYHGTTQHGSWTVRWLVCWNVERTSIQWRKPHSDIALKLANGAILGTLAPLSGSVAAFSGTVSPTGVISATIASGTNGCAVNLGGQATTAASGGATTATITGTYTLLASLTCNTASGSWTAARK